MIAQHRVIVDQLFGALDVVFDPAPNDLFAVEDHVAGARVPIPGLADRADVDDRLAAVDGPPVVEFGQGMPGIVIAGDNPRAMGVADETGMGDQGEILFQQLLGILAHEAAALGVLFENIFFEMLARARVHEQTIFFNKRCRKITEPIPASLLTTEKADESRADHLIGPQRRIAGFGIEPDRLMNNRVVMIAANDFTIRANRDDGFHRFDGFRAVAHDITQAIHGLHLLRGEISDHRIEGSHVAVDVTDDGDPTHDDVV